MKTFSKIFFAIVLSTFFSQQVGSEELKYLFANDELDQISKDYRKFLQNEYREFCMFSKYHDGKIHDARNSSEVIVSMVGDECDFVNDNLKVSGNAKLGIEFQETLLTADEIIFEEKNRIVEAKGNVRIYRPNIVFTGSHFRFYIKNPQFLLDSPSSLITVVSAKGRGEKYWRTCDREQSAKVKNIFETWIKSKSADATRLGIERRIKNAWQHPHLPDENAQSKVSCILNRDGTIDDLKLQGGGIEIFNQLSMKAVKGAAPFKVLGPNSPLSMAMEVTFTPPKNSTKSVLVKFDLYWVWNHRPY